MGWGKSGTGTGILGPGPEVYNERFTLLCG